MHWFLLGWYKLLFHFGIELFRLTSGNHFQIASPACTDLEVVMMDWLGKLLDLPPQFLACSGGQGGGVIQVRKI